MYDSRDVAAYIAQQCQQKGIEYNNTKIQKLLYCCYGVLLAWKGALICDETPRCWPHGPVFPKVFKYIYRDNEIADFSHVVSNNPTQEITTVVQSVLDRFGPYSASDLSRWSHAPGSPWEKTHQENGDKWNVAIPNEYVRDYFKSRVLKNG